MPNYPGNGQANLLRNNTQGILWSNETVTAPQASVAFILERINRSYYPWGVSFELWFSGDPGNFEVDVETADEDIDSHYCKINSWVNDTSLNSNYVGRIELVSFWARFVRLKLVSITNSVTISAVVTK